MSIDEFTLPNNRVLESKDICHSDSSTIKMRKRELQSFVVKLSDLKEYEAVRHERLETKHVDKTTSESSMTTPIVKFGNKTQKEIRERIGLSSM